MNLPSCLTEHRPLIEWNGHTPAPYVEAILVGVGPYRNAAVACWLLRTIALRKRIWLRRDEMDFLTASGFMRATILREADEVTP